MVLVLRSVIFLSRSFDKLIKFQMTVINWISYFHYNLYFSWISAVIASFFKLQQQHNSHSIDLFHSFKFHILFAVNSLTRIIFFSHITTSTSFSFSFSRLYVFRLKVSHQALSFFFLSFFQNTKAHKTQRSQTRTENIPLLDFFLPFCFLPLSLIQF